MKQITVPSPLGEMTFALVVRDVALAQPAARAERHQPRLAESIYAALESPNATSRIVLTDAAHEYLLELVKLPGVQQLPYPLSRMVGRVLDALWDARTAADETPVVVPSLALNEAIRGSAALATSDLSAAQARQSPPDEDEAR